MSEIERLARMACAVAGVPPDVKTPDGTMFVTWKGTMRIAIKALRASGYEIVLKEPDEKMLNAARDWSVDKYGRGVGNDGAEGCYKAMLNDGNLDVEG